MIAKNVSPNWYQSILARSVGLDPISCLVKIDTDTTIVFMEHISRKDYIINKATGNMVEK